MAFGQKAAGYAQTATTSNATDGDGEKRQYDSQWMPAGSGVRIFRVAPALDESGQLVYTERMSTTGKALRKGNKKDGEVLTGLEPAEETVFMSAWWPVMVNGELKKRHLMLNPNGNKARFNNPLWKHIDKHFPKVDGKSPQERNAIKLQFAMNVIDLTPVMRNEDGQLFYPAEDGTWSLLAFGNNGTLIDPKDKRNKIVLPEHYDSEDAIEEGYAVPLNAVRILQGSYGEPGGKHLFQQFVDLVGTVEDSDGIVRRLPEFDLRLSTKGRELKTNRTIRQTNNFKPLDDALYSLPRFDLETWTQPWPDEAIERLIALEDYNEIVAEYELAQFPKLAVSDETEATESSDFD